MPCLFQENKSYGVEPICIHPLMFITVRHKSRRAQLCNGCSPDERASFCQWLFFAAFCAFISAKAYLQIFLN
jgi:hypothetical protein